MASLCVNIDHIATLREARRAIEPDPISAGTIVELAGSTGVTVHLREDQRHIQERDVRLLRQIVQGRLNLEMASTPEMIDKALDIGPDLATLVPERREEVTTEGGLNVVDHMGAVRDATIRLQEGGIVVSLFIDPLAEQIKAARRCGASEVELHTGAYALARGEAAREELEKLYRGARLAREEGLTVNAGHGLNYRNVCPVAAIEGMRELNIGHAIVSRAVFDGLRAAVEEMARLIQSASQTPQVWRLQGW